MHKTLEEKEREELSKLRSESSQLKRTLESLFEGLENFITFLRFVLYVGSVAGSWFYLEDRMLAVAIACSLTVAHALICFKEYLQDKKKELTKVGY